ncbi:uncharacterized protein MONOS_17835 [Monocercomonoides exilis]|uniref:uncharacterized protein n=1 Tax=Monocercomonoides exilis TaxID=2049356 RepID=UPI00355A3F09|nr:hypothetical protein MONOS_17829 [Monocercomonoides exilis]KAH7820574.1 hypothetical protein MONOS_17835 [Monocercomonoides exilis]
MEWENGGKRVCCHITHTTGSITAPEAWVWVLLGGGVGKGCDVGKHTVREGERRGSTTNKKWVRVGVGQSMKRATLEAGVAVP